jgi:hypothetical protein
MAVLLVSTQAAQASTSQMLVLYGKCGVHITCVVLHEPVSTHVLVVLQVVKQPLHPERAPAPPPPPPPHTHPHTHTHCVLPHLVQVHEQPL